MENSSARCLLWHEPPEGPYAAGERKSCEEIAQKKKLRKSETALNQVTAVGKILGETPRWSRHEGVTRQGIGDTMTT